MTVRDPESPESRSRDQPHKSTSLVVLRNTVLSLLAGGLVVLSQSIALGPNGKTTWMWQVDFVAGMIAFWCVIMIPVSVYRLLGSKQRRPATRTLLSSIAYCVVFYFAMREAIKIRKDAFHALAERSMLLVEAIEEYEKANNRPPPNLSALVPDYLPSVPSTGMGAYPLYRYVTGQGDAPPGNTWSLEVFTPSGLFDFDRFLYYPNQNYESHPWGVLEPMGRWAYLHE